MINTVKQERVKIGLTQEELGTKVQVSRQTIHSIEAGRYTPSATLAFKIAFVLGKNPHELFSLEKGDWR